MTGDALHLVVSDMIPVEELGIVEALEEVGLPVAAYALLQRYRRISFDGVHMAGFTRFFCLYNGGVVIPQLAALFQENFFCVTGLAFFDAGFLFAILHMAGETGAFCHKDMITLYDL